MSQYLRDDKDWQSVRQRLLEAIGEPSDEDLRAVREAVKSRIAGERTRGRRWWIWNVVAATACVIAVLSAVDLRVSHRESTPVAVRPLELNAPVVAPRVLAALAVPHRARVRRERLSAGIRSVAWTTEGDGTSQLKLTTADPNVVILLPMGKASEEHEN